MWWWQVGRVVRCGEGVDAGRYEGRLVFSFLPHGHRHIVAEVGGCEAAERLRSTCMTAAVWAGG